MSSTAIVSTIGTYIPREKYSAALSKSIELEKNGDKLSKLGKLELAMREYKKSLKLEEVYLGQHHRMISDYHDKLLEKAGSLKRNSQRLTSRALSKSLDIEKEGDQLRRLGRVELAQRRYKKSYTIEKVVLGEEHPMVTSLKTKMIISSAC
jgi:tetratricopeptide (TPR) repeat protein